MVRWPWSRRTAGRAASATWRTLASWWTWPGRRPAGHPVEAPARPSRRSGVARDELAQDEPSPVRDLEREGVAPRLVERVDQEPVAREVAGVLRMPEHGDAPGVAQRDVEAV